MGRACSPRALSFALILSLLCESCFLASTVLGKEEGRAKRGGGGEPVTDSAGARRAGGGTKVGAAGAEAIAGGRAEKGEEDEKKRPRPPRLSSVPELSPR